MIISRLVKEENSPVIGKYMVGTTRLYGREVKDSPWARRVHVEWAYLSPKEFFDLYELTGQKERDFDVVRRK